MELIHTMGMSKPVFPVDLGAPCCVHCKVSIVVPVCTFLYRALALSSCDSPDRPIFGNTFHFFTLALSFPVIQYIGGLVIVYSGVFLTPFLLIFHFPLVDYFFPIIDHVLFRKMHYLR